MTLTQKVLYVFATVIIIEALLCLGLWWKDIFRNRKSKPSETEFRDSEINK